QQSRQRLGYRGKQREGRAKLTCQSGRMRFSELGGDHATARRRAARAGESFVFREKEAAVIAGQLVAGLDIANGDLEPERSADAVGHAGVIHEAGVVPGQDPSAKAVVPRVAGNRTRV